MTSLLLIEHVIDEITAPDVRRLARMAYTRPHKGVPSRARKAVATGKAYYKGIGGPFELGFETIAVTTPDRRAWQQKVVLMDMYEELPKHEKLIDAVRASLAGELKLHCNCPAFLYWGYKYILTKKRSSIRREPRQPRIRNPREEGAVCKHLFAIMQALGFFAPEITGDLQRYPWTLSRKAKAALKAFEARVKPKPVGKKPKEAPPPEEPEKPVEPGVIRVGSTVKIIDRANRHHGEKATVDRLVGKGKELWLKLSSGFPIKVGKDDVELVGGA